LDVGRVEVRPYLIGNLAYSSHLYLLKNFKPSVTNLAFSDKNRFYQSMNSGRVFIEQAFGALKN
jgi:hypothetical protein